MQLAGPLFNLGTMFSMLDETSVDIEELYHMLNTQPIVKEPENAKHFEFKGGAISFENIKFKHYIFDNQQSMARPELS